MSDTPHLALPLLAVAQAQKHVTVNEALARLDCLVQLSVLDRDLATPPGAPTEGDRYIVAASPTGAWDGHAGAIAAFLGGAWELIDPAPGWIAWIADEAVIAYWTGATWAELSGAVTALQNLALLGLGTTADAGNPFAAKLNGALFTARTAGEGGDGDLRVALDKEAAGNVASLLFQTGFSSRAEIGLVGDDNLSLKVSPDGAAWTTALSVDRTSGLITVTGDPSVALGVATKQTVDAKVAKAGDTMTGALQLPAGSISAPSLNFGGTGTGLFVPASNQLGVSIQGASYPVITFGATGLTFANNGVAAISVTGDSSTGFISQQHTTSAAGPTNRLYKARGTIAAPDVPASGDQVGAFEFRMWTGSTFNVAAYLEIINLETTPSTGALGTYLRFRGMATGAASITDVWRVSVSGGMQMYGTNTVVDANRHLRLRAYTVATLPSASPAGQMIYVSDETGGAIPAFSDGTNWRRVTDRTVAA